MKTPLADQAIVVLGALHEPIPGDPGAHGRFDERARSGSGWTAARLRLGKVGSIAALAGPVAALAIGYHEVTKQR